MIASEGLNTAQWVQNLVLLLLTGGSGGGVIAFVKLKQEQKKQKAETESVNVNASQLAVTVQGTVIITLQTELARVRKKCDEQEQEIEELKELNRKIEQRKHREGRE